MQISFSQIHFLFMHEITIYVCFIWIRYINFTSCLPLIYEDTILKFWMLLSWTVSLMFLRCLFLKRFLLSVFYSIGLLFYLYWFFIVLLCKKFVTWKSVFQLEQIVYLSLGFSAVENVVKRCVPNPKLLCKVFLSLVSLAVH